jgi:DNA modification methylase
MLAAMKTGRNSIGIEIDSDYCKLAEERLRRESSNMFSTTNFEFIYPVQEIRKKLAVGEKTAKYSTRKSKAIKKI